MESSHVTPNVKTVQQASADGEHALMRNDTQSEAKMRWGSANLNVSETHELLASARRRTTLNVLTNYSAPVELTKLAARVASQEIDGEVAEEKIVERVGISLHHVHLPKMAELGVIDYDPDTTVIERCP